MVFVPTLDSDQESSVSSAFGVVSGPDFGHSNKWVVNPIFQDPNNESVIFIAHTKLSS